MDLYGGVIWYTQNALKGQWQNQDVYFNQIIDFLKVKWYFSMVFLELAF